MFMDCYKTHWCPYSKYHQPWCLYVMSQHLLDYHEIWSTPSWLPLDSLELLRISAGSEYIMLSMLKQYESGPLVSVHLSHARLHSCETTNKTLINRVLLMEKTMTCETWTISNSRNCTNAPLNIKPGSINLCYQLELTLSLLRRRKKREHSCPANKVCRLEVYLFVCFKHSFFFCISVIHNVRGSAHAVTWNQARFVNVNGNIDVHESHDDWKQLQQKVALHQTWKQSSCCLRADSIAVCQNLSFLSLSLTVGFI